MQQANLDPSQPKTRFGFREELSLAQPEVVSWFEQHLSGSSMGIAIELAARYFKTSERWGEKIPPIPRPALNVELQNQVPSIDPAERWMTELPIVLDRGERRSVSRLLQALVTVSQRIV